MNNGCIAKSHRNKRIINLNKIGYSFAIVANKLKINRGVVSGVIWRHRNKRYNQMPIWINDNRNKKIILLFEDDWSFSEIAKAMNLTRHVVAGVIWRYKRRIAKYGPTQIKA